MTPPDDSSRYEFWQTRDVDTAADAILTGHDVISDMPTASAELFELCGTGSRALDYGCGVGRNTRELAKRFDTVVAYDFPNMVQLARDNGVDQVANISLTSSFDEMMESQPYDVVFASLVFQHMHSDDLRALLKTFVDAGVGKLVIATRDWMDFTNEKIFPVLEESWEYETKMPNANDHWTLRMVPKEGPVGAESQAESLEEAPAATQQNPTRYEFWQTRDVDTAADAILTGYAAIADMPPAPAELFDLCETGARALDYGCGVGRNTRELAKRFDTVVGYDFPNMVQLARDNGVDQVANISLTSSFDEMMESQPYDVVFASLVFQHMHSDDLRALLRTFVDAGVGKLVIATRDWMDFTNEKIFPVLQESWEYETKFAETEVGSPAAPDLCADHWIVRMVPRVSSGAGTEARADDEQ